MAPAAFDSDWAELRAPSKRLPVIYTSSTPHDDAAPDSMPVRAIAGENAEGAWIHLPIPAMHSVFVIGRDGGPAYLRSEVRNAEGVLTLAVKTLEAAIGDGAGASELTGSLVPAAKGRRTA
jgi:hypothetical protein